MIESNLGRNTTNRTPDNRLLVLNVFLTVLWILVWKVLKLLPYLCDIFKLGQFVMRTNEIMSQSCRTLVKFMYFVITQLKPVWNYPVHVGNCTFTSRYALSLCWSNHRSLPTYFQLRIWHLLLWSFECSVLRFGKQVRSELVI